MRYDPEHKERTRAKVLKEAARAIKANGPDQISVAGIMASAGLTHGGFYAHFKSRDDFIAETVAYVFDEANSVVGKVMGDLPPAPALAAYIDFYLSQRHRDSRAIGCPLAALSGDLSRLGPTARVSFTAGFNRLSTAIASKLKALGYEDPDALASSVLSELAGALMLSRATEDMTLSKKILDCSKTALRQRLGLEILP
ncbi:MAG: TetR/AcrR family transcriptional regulator [Parvibaculaceae bacterium]|nr:TetR/AcrR family transcriptional regulator [Parvibaculaceae bacterium]